ncbi:MAG: glycine cleavage system aminomethyltransferase GcvT [Deltaproteobacteria bacterium]|nr:glycine cleavage system aminomethyltransferase GcvT [Deltaproteobacteria bacterium]
MVKRTPLYSLHRALGARMTEFGGFEMPLSYSGIIQEHRAVRSAAGIFDLSHMGEFELRGSGALAVLGQTLTNSARRLVDGQAQYTLLCADDGGTLDDLILYRFEPDRFMLCVNAANIGSDWEWLRGRSHPGAQLLDMSDDIGLIAIQGPRAALILSRVAQIEVSQIRRFHARSETITGYSSLVARTGYTGEDGFEIFVAAQYASAIFEALLNAGTEEGILPCGLGARDTLRMEAGLPLYGHELNPNISPLEAGLAPFVKFGRGFVGERALTAQRDHGVKRRLVGLRTDDAKSIARQGYQLIQDGNQVGVVTSGTFAPSFDRPLAIGLVDATTQTEAGDQLAVEIRKRSVAATVVPLPFYRRTS